MGSRLLGLFGSQTVEAFGAFFQTLDIGAQRNYQ